MEFGIFKKIFFENITIKQTVFKNTFWLGAAEVLSGLLRLILLIYSARILGVAEYGKFTFALSFVSIMVIFSDLGVIDIATREFSRNKEREKEFSAFLGLGIILEVGALILMVIGSFFITSDPLIRKIIWILSFFILISSCFSIFYSFLRSRQKMEYEFVIKISQFLIIAGSVFFVLFYFPSAVNLSYGYFFSNLIALTFLLFSFHFFLQPIRLKWDKNIFKPLKIAWPLSLGFTGNWIYVGISSVILGYFNLFNESGWYNAASKIAYAAIMPAYLIAGSFYPMLSNFFIVSKEKLQESWDYLMKSMIFLTVPIITGGIMLAPKIIDFFYGSEFAPSIIVLQTLIAVTGIAFINYPYGVMLAVADHQRKNFALIALGIIADIILGFILIPKYGLFGAAMAAAVISIITLLFTIIVSKLFLPIAIFDKKLLKSTFVACFASFIMFFVIRQITACNLNVFLDIAIGFSVYFLTLLIFQKISALSLRDNV